MAEPDLAQPPARPADVDVVQTALQSGWTILIGLALTALALVAFSVLAFSFGKGFFLRVDEAALQGGYALRRDDSWLTPIMAFATTIGDVAGTTILTLLTCGVLAWRRPAHWRSSALLLIVTMLGAVLIFTQFKSAFGRLRPTGFDSPYHLESFSFPSGHSVSAAAFYGSLVFISTRMTTNRSRRLLIAALAALATMIIGLSRIFFSVHFPTDVLGGFCAGLGWLLGLHATWNGIAWRRGRLRARQKHVS